MLAELGADGAIRIARVVGQSAQRACAALRRRHEHVIGSWHGEDFRHRTAVTATRLAESERGPGPRAVTVTRAEAPVLTSHAFSARDLKRDEYPLADAAFADLISECDHLGHGLVSDRKRPGEEAERCHRQVK